MRERKSGFKSNLSGVTPIKSWLETLLIDKLNQIESNLIKLNWRRLKGKEKRGFETNLSGVTLGLLPTFNC